MRRPSAQAQNRAGAVSWGARTVHAPEAGTPADREWRTLVNRYKLSTRTHSKTEMTLSPRLNPPPGG